MIVQNLNIGPYSHRVELYKNNIDLINQNVIEREFVMLRSYEFRNTVIYDTEMYFIEKDIFIDYIKSKFKNTNIQCEDLTSGLIFPVTLVENDSFSLKDLILIRI